MELKDALLSFRFRDDGKANMPLTAASRRVLRQAADDFRRNPDALEIRESCPLCGGGAGWLIANKDRYGVPMPVCICGACGLVFSRGVMTEEFAESYYRNQAIALKTDPAEVDAAFQRRTKPDAYAFRRYDYVKRHLGDAFDRVKNVVEFGCADGCNLFPWHQAGRETRGYDLDSARLEAGCRAGLRLEKASVLSAAEQERDADLVILSHVLEHMAEPVTALSAAAGSLSESGFLYVEVPGLNGLIKPASDCATLDGYTPSNDFLGYLQFEHTVHLTLDTLTAFAARAGLHRIAGDEIVRAIFVRAEVAIGETDERAETVLGRLREIEVDYLKANPAWKRLARRSYHRLRSIAA